MGRRPLPTAVKAARGNPSKVPLYDNEPKPVVSQLEYPEWFLHSDFANDEIMDEAKLQWDKVVEESASTGVLTVLDEPVFALWCVTYARFIVACRKIALGIEDSNWMRDRNSAGRDLKGLSAELGFTPSSRSKVSVVGKRGSGPDWGQFDAN